MHILRGIIKENSDWYLDEIVQEMEVRSGKHVSVSTLWRSLIYCGITRKKREQLIFLDESSKDEYTIIRGYGYSDTNTRAIKKVVFVRGKRYTILPALALDVLDNAKIYHNSELLAYLDAFDVRVEFLPPYSPDLNPIEMAFSYIKNYLKRYNYL
ncbi:26696_t:CDS:2 [Gigaspora margarita]|uniref:26696_t:CDS:1 n=1 Tax=Gigaspora margarita TaxID=4874 RepID=A0ABN7VAY9_GIGMA|nr:26696_t:CDS:2 [Gigaspora margarita]